MATNGTQAGEKVERWQDNYTVGNEAVATESNRIGFWGIAFAVFVGNLMTAILVSIAYYALTH